MPHHGRSDDIDWHGCMIEFTGTSFFVLFGGLSYLGNAENLTQIGLAYGLMMGLMIISIAKYDAGHFNPALTIGLMVKKYLEKKHSAYMLMYLGAQLLASFVAAGLLWLILSDKDYEYLVGGAMYLTSNISLYKGFVCEMSLTFILVLTTLAINGGKKWQSVAPLGIGIAVAIGIYAGGSLTGAAMDPARAIGPSAWANSVLENYHMDSVEIFVVFFLGPICGGVVAALLYHLAFDAAESKKKAKTSFYAASSSESSESSESNKSTSLPTPSSASSASPASSSASSASSASATYTDKSQEPTNTATSSPSE